MTLIFLLTIYRLKKFMGNVSMGLSGTDPCDILP
jgi:hypothetical protein